MSLRLAVIICATLSVFADTKLLAGYTIRSAITELIISYVEIARVGGNYAVQDHLKSRPILVTMKSACTTP